MVVSAGVKYNVVINGVVEPQFDFVEHGQCTISFYDSNDQLISSWINAGDGSFLNPRLEAALYRIRHADFVDDQDNVTAYAYLKFSENYNVGNSAFEVYNPIVIEVPEIIIGNAYNIGNYNTGFKNTINGFVESLLSKDSANNLTYGNKIYFVKANREISEVSIQWTNIIFHCFIHLDKDYSGNTRLKIQEVGLNSVYHTIYDDIGNNEVRISGTLDVGNFDRTPGSPTPNPNLIILDALNRPIYLDDIGVNSSMNHSFSLIGCDSVFTIEDNLLNELESAVKDVISDIKDIEDDIIVLKDNLEAEINNFRQTFVSR